MYFEIFPLFARHVIADLGERRIALSRVQTGAKCGHSFSGTADAQQGIEQNFDRSRLLASTWLFVSIVAFKNCTQLLTCATRNKTRAPFKVSRA